MFFENDDRAILQKLADQEDQFIKTVRSADDNTLLRIHTAICNVLEEGPYLLGLAFRLKQTVAACQNITSVLGLQRIFHSVTEQMRLCLNCERAKIHMLDSNKDELWTMPEKDSDKVTKIAKSHGVYGIL